MLRLHRGIELLTEYISQDRMPPDMFERHVLSREWDMDASRAHDRDRPLAPLSAAVLAGGRSRRMGQDKALLRLTPEGPPLAVLVIAQLRAVADDIVLVGPERPGYNELGVPVVPDRFPDCGPLGGIATALGNARHEYCLVVGCDMPLLNRAVLVWMARQPRDYQFLLPRLAADGTERSHPLHAIYATSSLPAIERRLACGQLDVHGLANELTTRIVRAEEIAPLDSAFDSFVNVNSPDDLERVRARLRPNGQRPA